MPAGDVHHGDCREIYVLPPVGGTFNDPSVQAQISAVLNEQYPRFRWVVTTVGPFRARDFLFVPVVTTIDGVFLRAPAPQLFDEASSLLSLAFSWPSTFH
jgi:hypothetical protein